MKNEEVDRGQNSMSFKEKDLFNKRQREQWALSKDYRNKRRRELRLKKSDNQHTDNYTRYRQQLNYGRSERIICNHNEVGNLLDTNTSEVLDNMETNIVGIGNNQNYPNVIQPCLLKQALKAGFKHLVFEDKYDTGTGDHSFRQICGQFYIRGQIVYKKLKDISDQYAATELVRTQDSKEKIN
ncbi:Uncharacterized protein Fot_14855 [Forsythia ovata]|uniref:Uncharacterized protein n=1 Tax=Forsythia ovata TaxID=205694 RepID=A0ABD1W7I1_9LAMI